MRFLQNTVFPRIIAWVDSREAIISNIALWKSNNMGFFSSLINFQILNRHWSILLDLIVFQLDREGIKGREDGERGWREWLFEEIRQYHDTILVVFTETVPSNKTY